MIQSKSKARLFLTYLKDKTELFLYVKPHGTSGSKMSYRRAPGDAAMNLRIQSILDHAKVRVSEIEIWILLYPPEILTTTMYISAHASPEEIKGRIHEQIIPHLSYSTNYDWDHYQLSVHENGMGENMVTATILGKDVLPRIRSLLNENFKWVKFIGDGLQFLNMERTFSKQLRGQTYEMILPYDEMFYVAAFRSGLHVESSVLTHGSSSFFGAYQLNHQQVYMDMRQRKNLLYQPQIQPIVHRSEWNGTHLTPSAFPTWYISRNARQSWGGVNFCKNLTTDRELYERQEITKSDVLHLLD